MTDDLPALCERLRVIADENRIPGRFTRGDYSAEGKLICETASALERLSAELEQAKRERDDWAGRCGDSEGRADVLEHERDEARREHASALKELEQAKRERLDVLNLLDADDSDDVIDAAKAAGDAQARLAELQPPGYLGDYCPLCHAPMCEGGHQPTCLLGQAESALAQMRETVALQQSYIDEAHACNDAARAELAQMREERDRLASDLKTNAHLLALQTDLAREAENVAVGVQRERDVMRLVLDAERHSHRKDNEYLLSERDRLTAQYNELIMAVGNKWPEETRHQTALRYIRQAETPSTEQAKQALGLTGGTQ